MDESTDDLEAKREKFYKHIQDAKLKVQQGVYDQALVSYKKANAIHSSEKLQQKIEKLTKFIEELELDESDSEDESTQYENIDGLRIYKECWNKLYPYQKDGVRWFWNLYQEKKGGILGDDMGLGKTIQVIAFMSGMFDQGLVKYALLVVPKSLLTNWTNEFEKWSPGIRLAEFHGTKSKRERELDKIQRKSGVILTTYGTLSTSFEQLAEFRDRTFTWDYIILDEGHKIKNPNKTSKCVRYIPVKNRIILTGTPVQNNLSELWSLIDFVTDGRLLGSLKTFKTEFENPIVRARERDASNYEKRVGNEIAETLRKMIDKHLLRRRKADVFRKADDESSTEVDGITENVTLNDDKPLKEPAGKVDIQLSKKNDLIIWLYLSDIQLEIYKQFLQLDYIVEAMHSTRSPLAQLSMLKKISDHPRLLSSFACTALGLSEDTAEHEDVLVRESSKLQFVLKLVDSFVREKHRALIFSQSRKMLDIVDKVLSKQGVKLLRFDGRIVDPAERQALIEKYQSDKSYTCFLLTTQVGAVGLNLTAADRVIIFDPSWNPGNDAQAVDRAYRIGQDKDVIIYRLITCGTIEEKIYRKQIFKDALSKQTTGTCKNPLRYFARHQLRELFILGDTTSSATHGILQELSGEVKWDPSVESHLDFLTSLNIFGISDHNLVYAKDGKGVDEEVVAGGTEFDAQVVERAKRAQDLVTSEVNICTEISRLSMNDAFKSSDIRRYLPSVANSEKKKQKQPRPQTDAVRIVVPDSPTGQRSFHSPDSMHRSNHAENVIEIEDSLTEESESVAKSSDYHEIQEIKDSPIAMADGVNIKEEADNGSFLESRPSIGGNQYVAESPECRIENEVLIDNSYDERPSICRLSEPEAYSSNHGEYFESEMTSSTADLSVRDSIHEDGGHDSSQLGSLSVNCAPNVKSQDRQRSPNQDEKNGQHPNEHADGNTSSASYIEVVDKMCSPISHMSLSEEQRGSPGGYPPVGASPHTPVAASDHAVSTPKSPLARSPLTNTITSPLKELRRSAAALIYGLTKTNDAPANESSDASVEVIDAACSPLRLTGTESDFLKEQANFSSMNMQALSANSSCTASDQRMSFGLTDAVNHIDINSLQCSTPHQEKSVHPLAVERHRSFNWSAMRNLQIAEKSTESDGLSHFAGSESLFSSSANTDGAAHRLANHSHPTSTDLGNSVNGICTSSQYATSQSLFSEPTADGSKNKSGRNSQNKSIRNGTRGSLEALDDVDVQEADTMLIERTRPHPDLLDSNLQARGESLRFDVSSTKEASHVGDTVESWEGACGHADEVPVRDESSIMEEIDCNDDDDDDDDCESVSSNELNMVNLLSGNRSMNHEQAVGEYEDDFDTESDSGDSDDDLLLQSRRSLRRSILGKGASFVVSDDSPAMAQSPSTHHEDGTMELPLDEDADGVEMPTETEVNQGSFLSEQETATQPCTDGGTSPPLYVWDHPFYRRCPGNAPKNCILDEDDHPGSPGNAIDESLQSLQENETVQESFEPCPCRVHVSDDVKIRRCFCVLSLEERTKYTQYVKEAKRERHLGNEPGALLAFMKALEMADHDLKMQKTAYLLLTKLKPTG